MTPFPELEAARAAPKALPGHTLPVGTRLREYEVHGLIGEGACSIVYLAWDHSLQRKVAVKEYMPASMVGRVQGSTEVVVALDRHLDVVRAGLKAFINEARLLARFDHPSLVKVLRFWEDNGTGYMVMPCYEGPTLKTALAELGHVPSESELRTWLKPILDAVTVLHEGTTWHQNIGPDSIVLTPTGPVLLGFAAASHAIEAMRHTPAAALKPGFAAIEQYGSEAGTTRGPWTDLYALGAVVYAAITGSEPVPAADRLAHDRLRPLSVVAAGLYSPRFLAAIDAALTVQPRQRPADHAEFRARMGDIDAPDAVTPAPRPDLMQEPFAAATRDTVVVPGALPAAAAPASAPVPAPPPSTPVAVAAAPAPAPAPIPETTPPKAPPAPARVDDAGQRATPSWMKAAGARALGKRALYGVIAATCALIGIAALVVQLATRPATRAPHAAPTAAATPAPIAAASTAVAAPMTATAPVSRPPAPVARVAPVAAIAPVATVKVPVPPPKATAPTTAAPGPSPAAAALERQTRCTEILQKASLEKITPAETEFFKTQCK